MRRIANDIATGFRNGIDFLAAFLADLPVWFLAILALDAGLLILATR